MHDWAQVFKTRQLYLLLQQLMNAMQDYYIEEEVYLEKEVKEGNKIREVVQELQLMQAVKKCMRPVKNCMRLCLVMLKEEPEEQKQEDRIQHLSEVTRQQISQGFTFGKKAENTETTTRDGAGTPTEKPEPTDTVDSAETEMQVDSDTSGSSGEACSTKPLENQTASVSMEVGQVSNPLEEVLQGKPLTSKDLPSMPELRRVDNPLQLEEALQESVGQSYNKDLQPTTSSKDLQQKMPEDKATLLLEEVLQEYFGTKQEPRFKYDIRCHLDDNPETEHSLSDPLMMDIIIRDTQMDEVDKNWQVIAQFKCDRPDLFVNDVVNDRRGKTFQAHMQRMVDYIRDYITMPDPEDICKAVIVKDNGDWQVEGVRGDMLQQLQREMKSHLVVKTKNAVTGDWSILPEIKAKDLEQFAEETKAEQKPKLKRNPKVKKRQGKNVSN